jgi:hypothetical protein
MNTRNLLGNRIRTTLALVALSAMGAVALAAGPTPGASPGPTKETREKMAVLHEQMAACLRSDKPIADCHAEMKKGCQQGLGDQGCPMMGMGMGKRSHGVRPGGDPK